MFIETWRKHWGLTQDPFSCEDADKDVILPRMSETAVHSAFDRLYGDPLSPAPGIVFGEKGSGKSGLRLAMRRKLSGPAHGARVLCTEYLDFDGYLERFRRSVGAKAAADRIGRAVRDHWTLSDHLDALLSGGVTELVDQVLAEADWPTLTSKQKADLLLLTGFYYDSRRSTTEDALRRLRGRLRLKSLRAPIVRTVRILLSVVAVALALAPSVGPSLGLDVPGTPLAWYVAAAVLLSVVWGEALYRKAQLAAAARSVRNVRVLDRDPALVAGVLAGLDPHVRREFALPKGTDQATRYDHVARFESLMRSFGRDSWYVLVDRIDEPSGLNSDPDAARRFVETLLDHKLLQVPGLALKLFLPVELDGIYRNASPDELKRMRLDKSNLVPQLDWTGQELIEIANQRIDACSSSPGLTLQRFFAEDLSPDYLRQTLQTLGTPRYALGFLTSVFLEYARNLPGDLPEDASEWRVPRAHFDVLRASWIDQASLLRRKLN